MAFAGAAAVERNAGVESNSLPLLVGALIVAALSAMVASSYVGSLRFSPASLTVEQTQVHSSPVSLAQSKSGSTSTSSSGSGGSTSSGSFGSDVGDGGILPDHGVNAQAAANAFDNVNR